MTPERFRQIEELYHAAREREPGQRASFLAEACQGDTGLRSEVEALLASDTANSEIFKEPILREATAMLESDEIRSQHQIAPGQELGPYMVEARLGAGGMGEVYRAKDKRLGRTVALKVLPHQLTPTSSLRQRLEREAAAISALNHPHICTLYDIGRQDGVDYLVMEFLQGETLRQRLERGALPFSEMLDFAIQIAGALEAAHTKGIIHRDIKPANIFVVGRGQVKVLDFGLAKLKEPAPGSQFETVTEKQSLTSTGLVLGTVAYMSPEQARGDEVDARTDIFSFGVVLYEMATGKAPFRGKSTTLILDALLHATPVAPRQLRPELPATLDGIISTALEKDRELRYQTAAELRAALLRMKRDVESGVAATETAASTAAAVTPSQLTRRTAISALAGVAAGAAGGVFAVSRYRGAPSRNLMRFSLLLPEGAVAEASHNKRVAISRNGQQVAYNVSVSGQGTNTAANKFYLRSLSALEPKLLTTGGGVPFFSPDGQWLGFFGVVGAGNQQMRKISLTGGAPVNVCAVEAYAGATWADDNTIYFVGTNPGPLMRISAAGGQPQAAAKIDFARGERLHKFPCAIPGSNVVLFTMSTQEAETFDDTLIAALDTKTGQRKVLAEGGTHPRYSPSGHLIYARGGNLLALRFDPERLAVSGQPFTVLEGIVMSVNSGVANYDISASGDLIYVPGPSDKGARTLSWVDRHGKPEPVPSLPARAYLHPRISPDGRQLAIEIEGPNHDFYIYDFARAVLSKMTTDGESHWPVWSPDGSRLVYRSGHMVAWRMWEMPADRSRPPQQLPGKGIAQSAESWSPDGHALAYTAAPLGAPSQIMVESMDRDHESRLVAEIKAGAGSPKFSPDGRWLAYCSNESGRPHVYVQAYPGPGAKIQVSSEGGTDPVWQRAGGELYYRNGDKMMAVSVSTAPSFRAGRPQVLWEGHYSHGMSTSCGPPGATSSNYDVTADGKRFLMIKDEAPDTATSKQIVVVLGWADEVKRIEKGKGIPS